MHGVRNPGYPALRFKAADVFLEPTLSHPCLEEGDALSFRNRGRIDATPLNALPFVDPGEFNFNVSAIAAFLYLGRGGFDPHGAPDQGSEEVGDCCQIDSLSPISI
ncbi:MAG: hypothetical protein RL324_2479 [Verrucomicrobiota bacterium]